MIKSAKLPDTQPNNPAASCWLQPARQACLRVPPLWPLHSFVAVNPFVGLVGKPFAEVCELMQRVTHDSMLMSCSYFAHKHMEGRITRADLAAAITLMQGTVELPQLISKVDELLAWVENPVVEKCDKVHAISDIVMQQHGGNWSQVVIDEISKWCAAYFDDGQSSWRMPWRQLPLYAAWKQAAAIDANPEFLGLARFRAQVAALPDTAAEVIPLLLQTLGVHENDAENYLHRLLMTLPGWSGYVQYHVRQQAMQGTHDDSLLDLLAVRLVFEVALLKKFDGPKLQEFWSGRFADTTQTVSRTTQNLLLWHSAMEIGFQQQLGQQLIKEAHAPATLKTERPHLQAAFCIDVRSEVMRRSLEAVSSKIETLGFAGFFGMPIEHVPFGKRKGTSQVPVLLTPRYRVKEHLPDATPGQEQKRLRQMQLSTRLQHSWNAFKTSAVSCFSFVESSGVAFAWDLVKNTYQLGAKPRAGSCTSCTAPDLHHHNRHLKDATDDHLPASGIPPEDQLQLAVGALKNMGLTSEFAPLVMVCGHGSNTTNNPYAASLDCGACGGHAGDSNARVAAAILNQPAVRAGLETHGIHIPEDVFFIAALHDTTTDTITVFDADKAPKTHASYLQQAQLWLQEAGQICRQQRAAALGLGGVGSETLTKHIMTRSGDWSQVRPEWGLAGNAAFIAAPRARTKNLNLCGRVFLHNYDPMADPQKSTLELIMTAPMVVANWINLQYYASTVNQRLWGSGNKVTHNVVGTFGIQQGNGGDLQAGLPLQSVHNGATWMHEPLRLSVFIEASPADMDALITKHEGVRQLVENGWVHLFALTDQGRSILRRNLNGTWQQHGFDNKRPAGETSVK